MNEYRPTIGLEVHAELATRTKMFCESANDSDETRPNVNVCPVCLAHPGTLPTVNRQAVRHVLRVGVAVGGKLADYAEFDRKSYFYPDIPKGYQISQYEHPLVSGGALGGVEITRIHLEEDTARSSHAGGTSLVDFNRAGVPLMELVTEPVIHDAATAGNFARELQLLLRTLGVSHANLEKGEMRIEANISVSKDETLGTKVEVKNLNSFRSVERAIEYEVARHISVLESGGVLTQETRGWNEGKQETFPQRVKEGSADYRYFPEPDIPKMILSDIPEFASDTIRASLPELPWERRSRYEALGVRAQDAAYLAASVERSVFFDQVLSHIGTNEDLVRLAVNYIVSDLAGWYAKNNVPEFSNLKPEDFAELIRMTKDGDLSSRGAKDVLLHLLEKGGTPRDIAASENLLQVSDIETLREGVRTVLASEEGAVAEYRAGKVATIQYLVGRSMKATGGAGNPAVLKQLIEEEIGTLPN